MFAAAHTATAAQRQPEQQPEGPPTPPLAASAPNAASRDCIDAAVGWSICKSESRGAADAVYAATGEEIWLAVTEE